MPEGGFLEQKPRSPGSLAVVIALHAAAITALAMSKMDVPVMKVFEPIKIKDVIEPPVPPPEPVEKKVEKVPAKPTEITYREPIVQPPRTSDINLRATPTLDPPDLGQRDAEVIANDPPAQPKPLPPVRVDATMHPSSELQPPYPPSEQRMGDEGTVTVRLLIGTDGRVRAVEKVSATSDAFWRATERHALRRWRFRPATVDGAPVESRKQVTVHFRMES